MPAKTQTKKECKRDTVLIRIRKDIHAILVDHADRSYRPASMQLEMILNDYFSNLEKQNAAITN